MAFGYGHPNVDAAEAALAGGVGATAGIAQAVALDLADSAGNFGTPLIGGIKNSQLADFVVGGVTAGVGLAGSFGKGPTKTKQGVSAGLAGYGLGQIIVGAILNLTKTSFAGGARGSPAVPRGAPGVARWGGGAQGRGAAISPPTSNQAVVNALGY